MDRVLLLNGNYSPLATVTIPRAVNLLIGEKVEPVEGVARVLRTPNTLFEVPSVIVLKRFVNVPMRDKKWSRRGVMERDNYTCIYCGVRSGEPRPTKHNPSRRWKITDFTIEHIHPQIKGGKSTWPNTACACAGCNHRKGDKPYYECGLKLRWEPKTPRTNYWVFSGSFPLEWKKYIDVGFWNKENKEVEKPN